MEKLKVKLAKLLLHNTDYGILCIKRMHEEREDDIRRIFYHAVEIAKVIKNRVNGSNG